MFTQLSQSRGEVGGGGLKSSHPSHLSPNWKGVMRDGNRHNEVRVCAQNRNALIFQGGTWQE